MAQSAPLVDVSKLSSLTSKTAIETGGTGGLATAMTLALASSGANIISIELPEDPGQQILSEAVKSAGIQLHHYTCDVKDPKSLRATYSQIWNDGHKADILLSCAGIQRRAEAENFTDEQIEDVLDINLKATVVSCQEFAKPLLKQGRGGKMIVIASIIPFIGGRNITPYAASKRGVLQVTKAFSNEWAGRGEFRSTVFVLDPKYKSFNDYVMMRTPAKRWGEPVDLSGAIVFLASAASNFASGVPVIVDGGWTGN